MTSRLKLRQARGAWIAVPASETTLRALTPWTRLPVIVDDGDGRFDFRAAACKALPDPEFGAWWLRPARAERRGLLSDGAPFLLRRGFDRKRRTAGAKVAVFHCLEPVFGEDAFTFRIGSKIGEVE